MCTSSSLSELLNTTLVNEAVPFEVIASSGTANPFSLQKIMYRSRDEDSIPAFLWMPEGKGLFPAVLVHHQHNGEWHFGKSEVAGLVGNSLQAFGPALAQRGFVVLAPDSICFEDRRKNKRGTEPDTEEADWIQHYNEMSYRLIKGDSLMRKILDDASCGISLLSHLPQVDKSRIGCLGHSYGGNTVMFQAALDERIAFSCSSGAVCSYQNKMDNLTGIEMALVVPNIFPEWEINKVISLINPRPFLIVSAEDDKYAKDAMDMYQSAKAASQKKGIPFNMEHTRYSGPHALTQERFDRILDWMSEKARVNVV
jgi:dienelactone hydrolase